MTDKEKYIEFLKSIGFTQCIDDKRIYYGYGNLLNNQYYDDGGNVYIGQGSGYCGFYCQFNFNETDGVWE